MNSIQEARAAATEALNAAQAEHDAADRRMRRAQRERDEAAAALGFAHYYGDTAEIVAVREAALSEAIETVSIALEDLNATAMRLAEAVGHRDQLFYATTPRSFHSHDPRAEQD